MKKLVFVMAATAAAFASCTKEFPPTLDDPILQGGKGGSYSLAIFPVTDTGVAARVFMKYRADKSPGDTSRYDAAITAKAHGDEAAHAHFNMLTTGTYFIHAVYNGAVADTTITISRASEIEQDIKVYLK